MREDAMNWNEFKKAVRYAADFGPGSWLFVAAFAVTFFYLSHWGIEQ
jgi:hypothetical protein